MEPVEEDEDLEEVTSTETEELEYLIKKNILENYFDFNYMGILQKDIIV